MTSRSLGNAADAGLNVGWIRRLGMKIKGPVELGIGHAVHHDHEHFQLLRRGIITLGDQVYTPDLYGLMKGHGLIVNRLSLRRVHDKDRIVRLNGLRYFLHFFQQ